MSRHRYVRNLDLDAEMASDSDEDGGMTAEEQAQMATALPIARSLLKDLKPSISDDAIADSLWHYWFDVDKAVTWLRKDWEKKSEPIPTSLQPTPDEQRRRRSAKSARTQREESPQLPISALQRLSLARKEAASRDSPAPMESSPPALSSSTAGAEPAKPMSKLALLAQKRREEAQARMTAGSSASQTASATPVSTADTQDSPSKPLSKLALKMAAARAAKAEQSARSSPDAPSATTPATAESMDIDDQHDAQVSSSLFSFAPGPSCRPSPFFNLLTTHKHQTPLMAPSSSTKLHLPFVKDEKRLEQRVREAFGPGVESPDDIVLKARGDATPYLMPHASSHCFPMLTRADTKPTPATSKSASLTGKPRNPPQSVSSTPKTKTQSSTPKSTGGKAQSVASSSGAGTPTLGGGQSVLQQDLAGLHLTEEVDEAEQEREREKYREKPGLNMKQEELVAKVRKEEEESGKKGVSLIVVGHVDAGKSTLMGRLLYDIGELTEKEKTANERGSKRAGKSSFAFAWGLDALGDERDRGVTIDIATTHFNTPHRSFTLLDAPGHRDFIPAMISGAAQADVALLVVDGSPGEFEAGFERGGQTREHAWLVRSLGVKEIIVGINKMDVVDWSQDRYDDIVDALRPFLASAGFAASKTTFLPIAAMDGVNMLANDDPKLKEWYDGPTLIDTLDKVEVPVRPYESPLRIPVSNVFKGQTAVASGVAVSGRLCSGVLQVGDRVRAVPGDEVANVRTIEVDEESAPYAVAGQNVTLYLSGIDPIHLGIGTVLCPTNYPVPMVTTFTAQILVFDVSSPIITGTAVEVFHHSVNLPATISKLVSISEKGIVTKQRPRQVLVLQKGVTATVEITLRATQNAGRAATMPLEVSSENKEMGRVLIRRAGETIAAGK
ncbi:hypothetical protein DB88DRAFT_437513 [Papiliotrema laurentii]|uniref:Elongation factor 1 alpha-like protein n=1 Tax=Papiliotrema laurentii TaxID=5418 RepID=A0AAD9FS80_PAPLA|nr:hypothetical protein DB88DRAFT_437513 [Papiliotrema laurentii]